ncbi:MAG TPA: hypothetical protein VIE65_13920 [Methylobacter sp.]|jgi:hypothetical protein
MKIEIDSYVREDGLALIRLPDKIHWAIRRSGPGPAWFFLRPDRAKKDAGIWVISSVEGFNIKSYGLPFEEAMELFKIVPRGD